jgi:predicted transcriptional regulator
MIYEILSLAIHGASKTQLIFRVNLSHKLAERYVVFLVKKNLLQIESDTLGKRYLLTERGKRLYHFLIEVEKELADFYGLALASELKARSPASRTHPLFENEQDRVPIEIRRAATF